MRNLYILLLFSHTLVLCSENPTFSKELTYLQYQLTAVALQISIDNAPQVYNLLNASDFLQLSEQEQLLEGDFLVLDRPPHLHITHTYSHYGVAKNYPIVVHYPGDQLTCLYKIPIGERYVHIYYQYQQNKNGVILLLINDFATLTILPRCRSLEELIKD